MDNPVSDREYYIVLRKRKKIKLKEIADYIQCTAALLSMYENKKCFLDRKKELLYRQYIESKEVSN